MFQENNSNIPKATIDAVEDISIKSVVEHFDIQLKRRGENYVGLCPFHTDSRPSFYVSPRKNICKCFACGEGGNTISFVEKHEKVSFPMAVRMLAKQFNIDIPEVQLSPEEAQKEKDRESFYIALDVVQKQFQENYDNTPDARNYLQLKRQFSTEIIEKFGLGYATINNQLTKLLPSKGYNINTLLGCGVAGYDQNGNHHYDYFRNRLMFPFYDLRGKVIGFTGRDMSDQAQAKYLNSPTTLLFNKSQAIYGLYQAKRSMIETEAVHVVEGQADVISFHQHKVENTIAVSGTAFTNEQMQTLKRFVGTMIFVGDGDKAGIEATIRHIKNALSYGFDVKAYALPDGMDPDDLAKKVQDKLAETINKGKKSFYDYLYQVLDTKNKKDKARLDDLQTICDCLSVVPDESLRKEYQKSIAKLFGKGTDELKKYIKLPTKPIIENWETGFYGLEIIEEKLEKDKDIRLCNLTFNKKTFGDSLAEDLVIYVCGVPEITNIQTLRSKIANLTLVIDSEEDIEPKVDFENDNLTLLKKLHEEGFDIIIYDEDDEKNYAFSDWYIIQNSLILSGQVCDAPVGSAQAKVIARCVSLIANISKDQRTILIDDYAKKLDMKTTRLNELLKPILAEKRNLATLESMNLSEIMEIPQNTAQAPDYVRKNEDMSKVFDELGFFPALSKDGKRKVGYYFRNEGSLGFSLVSDFYINPLIHIYDKNSQNNKRIVELSHKFSHFTKYVEWESSIFVNMNKLEEKLFLEGNGMNFEGNAKQWRKIRNFLSYNFVLANELHILGWQDEGFYAFGNAIYHQVMNEQTNELEWKLEQMDQIGIAHHAGKNYYSPAFSKIHIEDRNIQDSHKQAINFQYKILPENKKTSFEEWASLMDKVYKIEDNGKWAIMFTIASAISDLIFDKLNYFYGFFLYGPTSSGKSELAASIRNVFMDFKADTFNLNTGTTASLMMLMERYSNVPIPLEEYNDDLDLNIIQILKAATFDRVGRTKVTDTATKKTSSSQVLVALIILGQYASQYDDGAFTNRCILKEVVKTSKEGFTNEETAIYTKLKDKEKDGLGDVLLEIIRQRAVFEDNFVKIFVEEGKRLREALKDKLNNSEGFIRILNIVAINSAICRIIEEYTTLKLPFSYKEFFGLATKQVPYQLDKIASTNKVGGFFNALAALVITGKIMKGRDYMIDTQYEVRRQVMGKETEVVSLGEDTKVLYINVPSVHKQYRDYIGSDAGDASTLATNFRGHPAYIGYCLNKQFRWEEAVYGVRGTYEIDKDDTARLSRDAGLKMESKRQPRACYMFKYEDLAKSLNIDLELLDEDTTAIQTAEQEDMPVTAIDKKEELPF